MSPIAGRRPFQEIVEVCQNELIREAASGEEAKYQGIVNQIYSNELPSILPELFIKKEAYLTLVADYTVGTVTVGTGTSNIKGASTSWTSAVSDNFLIKVQGKDIVYRMTFAADTSLTFQDSLAWTASSGSGLTYVLLKDRYSLPSDFSHMIADSEDCGHVVYRYVNGNKIFLNQLNEEEYEKTFNPSAGIPYGYLVKWIKETPYLYITLAADSAEILGYSYIPQLTTLTEYTTGTVTLTTGTAVIGSGTSWLANVDTSINTYYLRNDADGTGSASRWVKILSVGTNTAITLASAWSYTSGAGQTYTISEISKWPARFDDAMLYRAALIVDPDGINTQKWNSIYLDAVSMNRSEETRRSSTSQLKSWAGMRRR